MCGIVGCKLKRPLNPDDVMQMRGMRDQLSHRGPDGAGEYITEEDGLYFGHRRLSILDPEARSAQPFVNGGTVLTYNGEIYNYLELRSELSAHVGFETSGDTEVLLKAWQLWGAKCLDKLDGMYAFAIQDKNAIHLVTDPFGEKPLYVYENDDGLYFASEAKPLITAFNLEWKPTHDIICDFLNLGYIRPPHTGYKGLQNIPPATHITIKPDGTRTKQAYWAPSLPPPSSGGTIRPFETSQIDTLRDLLCESLEMRLRSDVPIGLFLSGGIDSALIAALATKELGATLQSYTVSFGGETDESESAANIAHYLGIENKIISTKSDNACQNVPQNLLDLYGVPNDNMTGLAVHQMCVSAKEYLTVALSGLGGDELFMGYNKYANSYKNRSLYDLSPYIQSLLPLLDLMPFSKTKTAAKLLRGSTEEQFFRLKNGDAADSVRALGYGNIEEFLTDCDAPLYMKARQSDLMSSMPQSYIPAVDRASMKQAIEVRTPFLNRTLLNYVWGLDQRALIHFGKKNMLSTLLSRYMPLELLTPRKQGFVYPIPRQLSYDFKGAPWYNEAEKIEKKIKEGSKDYERLALRISILSELESGSNRL
ncbi:MAG: asparagine synthase (glutamine-hydrolyzing) [Alphaproteobacteria bacterium]